MANRIKGITIEIGGDTTKLDKALSGTNKEISTTKSALKDVERLLKMDPGNVTLLEQKQRLLADAVTQTGKKLDTLRDAAKNANAALERGTAYRKAYDPLKESADAAKASLADLQEREAQLVEDYKAGKVAAGDFVREQDALWSATETTSKELASLEKEIERVNKQFRGDKLDQAQYDNLQRELAETEAAYKAAGDEADKFNATAERISGVADKVSDGAGKIADKTKAISTAAAIGAGALVGLAVNAGKTADDLNTLSKQSGFSTEILQEWQYAADFIDVQADDIISAAAKMKRNMGSTSPEVQNAFLQLGVAVRDVNGEYRDATDVFYQTLDSLSHIENETERDILAMTLFGKSADQLAGIVDDGGQALRDMGREAKEAGLILSQDALDGANAFKDGLDELKVRGKAAFMEAGASLAENLLPVLEDLLDIGTDVLNWLANLDGSTLSAVTGVLLAVGMLSPVIKTVSDIAGAFSNLVDVFGSLNVKSWILIIALTAIAAAVLAVMDAWDDMSGLQKVVAILGLVSAAALTAAIAFGAFQSAATMGIAAAGIAAGLVAVVAAVTAAHNSAKRMADESKQMPHLANGAVTGVNRPFAAIVGDNPNEPEVISPYSVIRQAAADAMLESGSSGNVKVDVRFTGSLSQLARVLTPEIEVQMDRRGPSAIGGASR